MHSPSTLIRLREDAGQGTPLVLLVAAGASSSPTTVLLALLEPDAIDRSLAGKLSGVTIPVLAMFGTRGEASPPPLGKVYKQAMPNCHLTYVYAADAGMDRQRPEAVAAALGEFMQTRERYLVTTKSSRLYP